jgi:protoporphyrinogen/coproporphyrinogen III oxidase
MKRIVIIGGGISGLAAAHRLFELSAGESVPIEVQLLEASSNAGGVIRTHSRDGFLLEAGPDAFISEKPEALSLIRRLGLDKNLIETNPQHRRSFVARGNKLIPVPEGFQLLAPSRFLPFLKSDILSWRGKARMTLDLFLPRRAHVNGIDDESLAAFVRRRMGREALERIAQPMIGGIYTADPELLSLRATMPRFIEMERKHRSLLRALWHARKTQTRAESSGTSGARYSLFLSLDGGMQMLVDALVKSLPANSIRLDTRAESLAYDANAKRWKIGTSSDDLIYADAVCIALPAYAAGHLLRDTDPLPAKELDGIQYASTATLNLAYRRADIPHRLDGFGFVVPFIEGRATLACSFSSVKFAGRAPEDSVLLRAFVGGALQPETFDLDDEKIIKLVRKDLRDLLGIESPPHFAQIEKWPSSMAQYHLGHIERVDSIRERLRTFPSLELAGNAYSGAGIPDCIRSGESAAERIVRGLAHTQT